MPEKLHPFIPEPSSGFVQRTILLDLLLDLILAQQEENEDDLLWVCISSSG